MRVTVCLALMLSFVGSAAIAQEPLEKVTVNVRRVPLRAALKQMLSGTSVTFRVDDNVPDAPVTMNVRDVGAAALLRLVVRVARETKGAEAITLVRENGVYRLKLDPEARARRLAELAAIQEERDPPVLVDAAFRDPRLERKITQSFKKRKLREVADALFAGTGCQYSLSEKTKALVVSFELKNVSLLDGLRQLTAEAAKGQPGLRFWRDGEIYIIGPKHWKDRPDQP